MGVDQQIIQIGSASTDMWYKEEIKFSLLPPHVTPLHPGKLTAGTWKSPWLKSGKSSEPTKPSMASSSSSWFSRVQSIVNYSSWNQPDVVGPKFYVILEAENQTLSLKVSNNATKCKGKKRKGDEIKVRTDFQEVPSLKLTWHLKIGAPWNLGDSYWKPWFLGANC